MWGWGSGSGNGQTTRASTPSVIGVGGLVEKEGFQKEGSDVRRWSNVKGSSDVRKGLGGIDVV